ncbi:MAG: SRPBCC domain-containing protein [Gemmatimonadota bacterium]
MSTSPGTDRVTPRRDTEAIPPVRKSILVPWPVERTFRRFTQEMADWWPLDTYSVGEAKADTVTFEGRVGGRLFETLQDGTEAEWGRVIAWEPPVRVAFTWHPGRTEETRQEIEVTFRPEGEGARVELVHTGWERIAEKPRETRDGYETGWDFVLDRFVEA